MACSSHWNKVIPKKHQTFFSPKSQYSFTSTITALLNRQGEKKEEKFYHEKKPKLFPAVIQNFRNISKIVKNHVNCTFPHRTKIRKFCPRAVNGKRLRCRSSSLTKDLKEREKKTPVYLEQSKQKRNKTYSSFFRLDKALVLKAQIPAKSSKQV